MIRIAHVSDLHVFSRTAAEWRRIVFNKRLAQANSAEHDDDVVSVQRQ